jgi:hypothetical protein
MFYSKCKVRYAGVELVIKNGFHNYSGERKVVSVLLEKILAVTKDILRIKTSKKWW